MKISKKLLATCYSNHSDTNDKDFLDIWDYLEKYQDNYLEKLKSNNLWPDKYYWPIDALHTNTRVWEYPFVLNAINNFSESNIGKKLLDIGSALTFFPQLMTDRGYSVTSIDIDEQLVKWANDIRNSNIFNANAEAFKEPIKNFIKEDVSVLNLEDNSFDIITNISVLEHIPFAKMPVILKNIYKKLKDDGIFICTLDSYLSGERTSEHMPLTHNELDEFMSMIFEHFELVHPHKIVGLDDIITNDTYPFSRKKQTQQNDELILRLKRSIKYFMDEKYFVDQSIKWTALGFVLRKKK